MKNKIKKLIVDHVKQCRRQMSWSGENDIVVQKIMKIIKETG
tara:strand:+ start:917 stop:1042 length:126 start_codon:yes stop_codon:yes gene_type:complete